MEDFDQFDLEMDSRTAGIVGEKDLRQILSADNYDATNLDGTGFEDDEPLTDDREDEEAKAAKTGEEEPQKVYYIGDIINSILSAEKKEVYRSVTTSLGVSSKGNKDMFIKRSICEIGRRYRNGVEVDDILKSLKLIYLADVQIAMNAKQLKFVSAEAFGKMKVIKITQTKSSLLITVMMLQNKRLL